MVRPQTSLMSPCSGEVACSASDRQGSKFESFVWRTVSSYSSHYPQEVLLAQFSLYVHKGGLKPDSFHFYFMCWLQACQLIYNLNILKCISLKSDTSILPHQVWHSDYWSDHDNRFAWQLYKKEGGEQHDYSIWRHRFTVCSVEAHTQVNLSELTELAREEGVVYS